MNETDVEDTGVMTFPKSFNIFPTLRERRTDLSGYLQDAINYCLDNQIGTLKLEPGFYPIAVPLIIHSSKLTIASTAEAKASLYDSKRVPIIQLMKDADQAVLVANKGLTSGEEMIGAIVFRNIAIRSVGKATRMGLLTFYNGHSCEVTRCYVGGAFTPGGFDSNRQHVDTKNAHQGHLIMMLTDRTKGSKAVSWLNKVSYCYLHWAVRNALVMESSDSWIERNYISHTAGAVENDHSGNEYAGNHIDNSLLLGDETALSFVERNPASGSTNGSTMVHGNYFDIHECGVRLGNASTGTVISANHFRACRKTYIDLANAMHISVTANCFRKFHLTRFSPVIGENPRHVTIANNINFNPFEQKLSQFLSGNTLDIPS